MLPKAREFNLTNTPSWESKHGLTISRIANDYDAMFQKDLKRRLTVDGEIDSRSDDGTLHMMPRRGWSREEERKIIDWFEVMPIYKIAINLQRTAGGCINRAYALRKSVKDSYDFKRGLNPVQVGKVFDSIYRNTGIILDDINEILKRSDESIFRTKFYYSDENLENEVLEMKSLWRRGESVFTDYGKIEDDILTEQPVAEIKTESKTDIKNNIGFKMVPRWVDLNKEIQGRIEVLKEDMNLKRGLVIIDFVDKESDNRFQVEIIVRNVENDKENYKIPNTVLEL